MNLTERRRPLRRRITQPTGLIINPWNHTGPGSVDRYSQRARVLCGALFEGDLKGWEESTRISRELRLPFYQSVTGQWSCGLDVIGIVPGFAPSGGLYDGSEYGVSPLNDDDVLDYRIDLRELFEKLAVFRNLENDWDGSGATKTTVAAYERAVTMLVHAMQAGVLPDFIAPLPDGGLQREWGPKNDNKLVVAIDPMGTEIEFVFIAQRGAAKAADGEIKQASDLDQYLRIIGQG